MKVVLKPEFVEFIPEQLDQGKIYISETYATSAHKCCCGCGNKVVTPLNPTGWKLTVDNGRVSLYPSIGNWSFPCRSHYWIKRNEVVWSYDMSQREIDAGRRADAKLRERYYSNEPKEPEKPVTSLGPSPKPAQNVWDKLWKWLGLSDPGGHHTRFHKTFVTVLPKMFGELGRRGCLST
jgi:hypothetical protein